MSLRLVAKILGGLCQNWLWHTSLILDMSRRFENQNCTLILWFIARSSKALPFETISFNGLAKKGKNRLQEKKEDLSVFRLESRLTIDVRTAIETYSSILAKVDMMTKNCHLLWEIFSNHVCNSKIHQHNKNNWIWNGIFLPE